MHGWDADKRIKSFRKKIEKQLQGSTAEKHFFTNPTEETPVETSAFLKHLNLEWVDPILKELFPRFKWIKHRLYPRMRLVLFQKLRPDLRKVSQAYRVLKAEKEVAKNLGFDPDSLPGYETIRHFINDLLNGDMLDETFYDELREINQQLKRLGEQLGKNALEDATIITAKRDDPEAVYSGYYEDWGWKKDLLIDQKHKIFLGYYNLGITENEGQALQLHLEKLQRIGISVDCITADGKYPTYLNIAIAKHQFGTDLFYRPQKDWVHNIKGDIDEINKQYQHYWKHDDFKVQTDISCKLGFLCKRGDVEHVGAYYRNQHVRQYNRRLKHCVRRYRNERNANEGFNGYLKQHMGFETSLPSKGEKQAFKHTTLCLIAVNAVVLTRLQNGITKNLTSVAYLT